MDTRTDYPALGDLVPRPSAPDYTIKQHIGWLRQYIDGMNERNWRDMRLRCDQQLSELSKLLLEKGQ